MVNISFEELLELTDEEQIEVFNKETRKQNEEFRVRVAQALVDAFRQADNYGDMWKLVSDMYNIDKDLVSKLEFIISSCFIDRDQAKGGHRAH